MSSSVSTAEDSGRCCLIQSAMSRAAGTSTLDPSSGATAPASPVTTASCTARSRPGRSGCASCTRVQGMLSARPRARTAAAAVGEDDRATSQVAPTSATRRTGSAARRPEGASPRPRTAPVAGVTAASTTTAASHAARPSRCTTARARSATSTRPASGAPATTSCIVEWGSSPAPSAPPVARRGSLSQAIGRPSVARSYDDHTATTVSTGAANASTAARSSRPRLPLCTRAPTTRTRPAANQARATGETSTAAPRANPARTRARGSAVA